MGNLKQCGEESELMKISEIVDDKTDFMDILLIGDEDEAMVRRYLGRSRLFVLYDRGCPASACAVVLIDENTAEIKNLATYPQYRCRGYASALLDFVCKEYRGYVKRLILGTGENDITLAFYEKRGFVKTHRIKNFFIDNYPHPIFENGKQLTDMIYLSRCL